MGEEEGRAASGHCDRLISVRWLWLGARVLCGPAFGLVAEDDALDDGLEDVLLVCGEAGGGLELEVVRLVWAPSNWSGPFLMDRWSGPLFNGPRVCESGGYGLIVV